MARTEFLGQTLIVEDCQHGGDHQAVLDRVVGHMVDDEKNLLCSIPCTRCAYEVVVYRDPLRVALESLVES